MPDATPEQVATVVTVVGIISFVLATETGRKVVWFVIKNFHYVIILFFVLMAIVAVGR